MGDIRKCQSQEETLLELGREENKYHAVLHHILGAEITCPLCCVNTRQGHSGQDLASR